MTIDGAVAVGAGAIEREYLPLVAG